jgi:alpha-tubulin suppressor-like RCC1 family protein
MSGRGLPLAVLLSLCCGACNLVLGLEREDLPEKTETPCTTNPECDDHHGCTRDICQLPLGTCTHYMLTREDICRLKTAQNLCDVEDEYCDGTHVDCPEDTFELAGVECRAANGQCDEPETCSGSSPECPDNVFSPSTKACDDGDDCTFDDSCDGAGGCVGTNGLQDAELVSIGPWGVSTCALLSTDAVRCWGSNGFGQLGDGTAGDNRLAPVATTGLPVGEDIVTLAVGGRHACVILGSSGMMCWGLGDSGQLGNNRAGTSYEEHSAVSVEGTPEGWRQVTGGYFYTCAIQEDDSAWCWGKNDYGQLGNGSLVNSPVPVAVTDLEGVSSMTAGSFHTCAADADGSLWCWGRNDRGQLGNGTTDDSSIPIRVEAITARILAVALGTLHTCALLESGDVMCWGNNEFGQLGNGTTDDSLVPVAVSDFPSPARQIASGYEHTCVILEGGEVMCWGHNERGQVGDRTEGNIRSQPVSVEGLPSGAVSIGTGTFHTCVVLENKTLLCWGYNAHGELGNGTTDNSLEPVVVLCG